VQDFVSLVQLVAIQGGFRWAMALLQKQGDFEKIVIPLTS